MRCSFHDHYFNTTILPLEFRRIASVVRETLCLIVLHLTEAEIACRIVMKYKSIITREVEFGMAV